MTYDEYTKLNIDIKEGILTIAISNPAGKNCIDAVLHHELARVFQKISLDDSVRVVVITGDPEGRAFCAGGDLKWMRDDINTAEDLAEMVRDGAAIVNSLLEIRQPVIAMINGHAVGLGATIALLADVSFMSAKAVISDPHVNVGIVAGDGGALLWPLLIGPNRAKEFLMTGDPINAEQAANIGLVNHCVDADALEETAMTFAKRLATGPRMAIELTKKSVNLMLKQLGTQLVPASLALETITFTTADHKEAVRAFLAKETPKFS
ncbi:enoyl-CoA hydratase/isomerase family protein [Emcibacter nanhaiensis]|uniref:Enoyl-CoA hydratase/isomerase family protein n=1 Tax=Emcibacter nanhaiensis TaxID=1505037 RepID=A0A501P930_9PROT|nr:enoyl-CoA hydratase-related protein [Emcibacter nanhaiensis]TPD56850.1 enoyl-CoA hydratase/isomerase family protein [Emcibacter nanhaiensis]